MAHWNDVRVVPRDVGRALQTALRAVEAANPDRLDGIFDELGNAYEFLIKKFADDSGHTAQEFYTNRTLVHLMVQMLQPKPGERIYDPTCGTGGMLISVLDEVKRGCGEYRTLKLYGQARNHMTASIARMNLALHGVDDFAIARGDTLERPAFTERDRLATFDVVLANPPYSIKQWNREAWASDAWGRNFLGTPPPGPRRLRLLPAHPEKPGTPSPRGRGAGGEGGRCAILFPRGVLFRKEEAEMRQKLIEADLVECVLGLGPNLFYNSPMEACVVVCRTRKPPKRRGQILLIDAVEEVARERAQSFLKPEQQARILSAYTAFEDERGFARVVSADEVAKQDYSLSIPLYVKRAANGGANGNAPKGKQQTLPQLWEAWEQEGRAFWQEMDALVETLDNLTEPES